jgi:poly(hydroxyalkanoate) depolymerase family esterase
MNARTSALSPLGLAALALCTASCGDAGPALEPVGHAAQAVDTLTEVTTFGTNPGNLLMYAYVPQNMPPSAPLVLALHGCTEGASDYEAAGWDALADQYHFYVVYPQQQSSNNIEECFNWFGNTSGSTEDITRGQGEAASIISMIDNMKSTYSIDPKRIYSTGFSAGAAYAVALLALYPDVFAAGSSFSGIPFGCATSLTEAYTCMDSAVSKTPDQWGTLVKAGFAGYGGPYPRISIWQGSADTTVNTANLTELVQQWTDVTGVSQTATSTTMVNGFPHAEYADSSGVVQVESYSITGMSHAVAIDPTNACGTAGTYFIDEKTCAVSLAAQFFGIVPASGGGSSSGGSSGGVSSGNLGSSSGGGSSSGASSGGTSSGASSSGADAPDAGAAAVPDMPGCSVSWGGGSSGAPAIVLAGLALGVVLRRRTRRASRHAVTALALGGIVLLGSATARADDDDQPPPAKPATPTPDEKPAPKHAYMGPQGAFYTGASVSQLPAVLFGYFPVDHLATTVGLGFTYDANGSPTSPLTGVKGAPNNKVGSDMFLDLIYFVHDQVPFAMGPEVNFIGSLSPNYPMTAVVFTPMWALRYAPWKAPIAIGTGIGVSFTFVKEMKPVASLATQGLDIVYAF